MAFNPDDYNLIDFTGLASASSPTLDWLLTIQNPSADIIYQLTAQQLSTLLNGSTSLPDGIINGLIFSVDNSGTPKIGTVSVGNYRIANTTYSLSTEFDFNINASGGSDRIDAVLADNTGLVYYQPNYTTLPANTILIALFTVPTGGGNIIAITQTSDLVTAYMNSLNNGDFDITGSYKVNGVPIGTGSGTTSIPFTEANLVPMGDDFYKIPLVLTSGQVILGVKVAISGGDTYQKPASDWINDEIINFYYETTPPTQTITVITS